MTLNLLGAEPSLPESGLTALCIFLLEQLGGSVSVDQLELENILNSKKLLTAYRTEYGAMIFEARE